MKKPYLVAITGGIGSGKTTVLNIFKGLGIPAYIADEKAKMLMNEDEILMNKIKQNFGDKAYKNGDLDKAYLSKMVFEDKEKLTQLNHIVHPAVREDFKKWAGQQHSPYVVYESALIFEHHQQHHFDAIILVTAPEDLRIKRVMSRSNLNENDVKNRIEKQMSDELKRKYVNYIIENINIHELKSKVDDINTKIMSKIPKNI